MTKTFSERLKQFYRLTLTLTSNVILTFIVIRARAIVGIDHVVTRAIILAGLGETIVNHVTQFT